MSDERSDDDPIMDLWYSNWEQQCVEAIEAEPDYENQLHNEKELYSQQIWTGFQTTASAIAQLYRGEALRIIDFSWIFIDISTLFLRWFHRSTVIDDYNYDNNNNSL